MPKITVSLKDDSNSSAYRNLETIEKDVYLINNSNEQVNITLPHTTKDVQKNRNLTYWLI